MLARIRGRVKFGTDRNDWEASAMTVGLTHFAGRVGDHNDRAMIASPTLARELSALTGSSTVVVGTPQPAKPDWWDVELAAARPDLVLMQQRYEEIFDGGHTPVTALSRCATALATLPVVARYRPDAVVVWFDAHADLNTPEDTTTGYLGGLALSGPMGLWNSGLGAGLEPQNAVLVGTRDLDPPEQALVDDGKVVLVPVGPDMAAELQSVIADRPVYVHIDCDVLEPHTVPTDYHVAGGMTLAQLHSCARALARSEVVGIEIGELEADAPDAAEPARRLIDALRPILAAAGRQ